MAASDTNACTRTCTIMMTSYDRYVDTCICTPARAHVQLQCHNYVGHASYGRVQTALKVWVCAAVLRETYLHACPRPRVQKFTPRNTATRSTKTKTMTVHVNAIDHASCAISTPNHFDQWRQVISYCFTPRNFSLSESDGGLISSSNRVHGTRNCSQEGSRTASRFAIQVDRDGR